MVVDTRSAACIGALLLCLIGSSRGLSLQLVSDLTDSKYSSVLQIAGRADFALRRYTLFAPENAAFDKLGCLGLWNQSGLATRILEYHLLDEPYSSGDILDIILTNSSWNPTTLYQNNVLRLTLDHNTVRINGGVANITSLDVLQGYSRSIHGINAVLIPPGLHVPSACASFVFPPSGAQGSADNLARSRVALACGLLVWAIMSVTFT